MLRFHTILHPTDFSERSQYAFELACMLTRDHGSRLVLLHVTTPPMITAYGQTVVPLDSARLHQEAEAQLERLEVPHADVRAERRLVEGAPAAEVLRIAQEIAADVIVMGTHGRTGLRRLMMGSVAEQVVREATCPVLTVSAAVGNGVAESSA